MKLNNFEMFATIVCSWLPGFFLGLWRLTPYITDREVTMIVGLSIIIVTVVVHKHLNNKAVIGCLNRHVGEIHNMMLLDLREFHRKRVSILKANHNQSIREAQDELRRLYTKFDRLHSEYDWISTMYQDQMRTNQEHEDRITFLDVKVKELGQLSQSPAPAPFSAPASWVDFVNPRRARGATRAPSPLPRAPLIQVQE